MATFNILGFNQEKIMAVQEEKQINLNGNDLIVLRNIVDMIDSKRLETKEIYKKKYTWIKYSLLKVEVDVTFLLQLDFAELESMVYKK